LTGLEAEDTTWEEVIMLEYTIEFPCWWVKMLRESFL